MLFTLCTPHKLYSVYFVYFRRASEEEAMIIILSDDVGYPSLIILIEVLSFVSRADLSKSKGKSRQKNTLW